MSEQELAEGGKATEIVYTVNGEKQETSKRKLTGGEILTNAKFTPIADWVLTRDEGGKAIGSDEEVEIHPNERFTAKRKGPTPTS
ncbi:MAG: hypothetical protein ACRDLM_04235 [Gaiellaceae bacterium]